MKIFEPLLPRQLASRLNTIRTFWNCACLQTISSSHYTVYGDLSIRIGIVICLVCALRPGSFWLDAVNQHFCFPTICNKFIMHLSKHASQMWSMSNFGDIFVFVAIIPVNIVIMKLFALKCHLLNQTVIKLMQKCCLWWDSNARPLD